MPLAVISGPSSERNVPVGMTLDHAGNLLVANEFGGSLTEYLATDNGDVSPQRMISGLSVPVGADVDAQGNIYVASGLAGVNAYAPTANGSASPLATISGPDTGVSGPTDVAVAPPFIVRTRRIPAAHRGRAYRARLRGNLGTTPYRWRVGHGRLPAGLLCTATGR